MTAIAVRKRPFHDPHPVGELKAQALRERERADDRRTAEIDRLARENPEQDRMYWTLLYDLEHAPCITARALLLEHGIVPVPPQELGADQDLHDELWTVLEAMSKSSVYLLNTDHLNDRELYCRLYYRILDEPCRRIPPAQEAAEFIDCLHPLDTGHPLGTQIATRGSEPSGMVLPRDRGPICNQDGVLVDRDRWLPRPKLS